MIIEEKDFRLLPTGEDSPKFDLELLCLVQPRGGKPRLEFKIVAYSISLDTAIKKIAHFRVARNHRDEAIKLVTYFKEFKANLDSLKELCMV